MCNQDVFIKLNSSDNGQFQRRPKSQGQIFDTSRKILSQEMAMCRMKALVSFFLRSYDQCKFFFFFIKLVKCRGQKVK